ncbi:hypothetical protein CBS101457_002896 [Exobasidium rhododendri]|nr:hypothetical protein CBS101457_002896 [Exobasidium rhododendri]
MPDLTLPAQVQEVIQHKSPSSSNQSSSDDAVIIGIAVVDFNHLVGPQVEYAHPKELLEDEELCANLPFLALPDGSHQSDEDFCYFHLISKALSNATIFGISCNRQIASSQLTVKGKEVTRSTVQKAIVVLARDPVFGPIKEKLGVVTRAFFAQANFGDVDILIEFHATLEAGLRSARVGRVKEVQSVMESTASAEEAKAAEDRYSTAMQERETVMYMGTSLRELIYKWRFKTLMLLKLLLLQKKIMFFGYPVERLCTYQYSLISLIPDLLFSLEDAGSPAMDKQSSKRKRAESLKTSDRKSLMRFMGLPLHLFGQDSFFQPYLPLQQIDMASKSKSYLVGTTNSIFKQQKECAIDVIVDLEHSSLEFLDPKLQQIVNLTAADRKWMDEIVGVVVDTWNAADPSRPSSMQFLGSDDYLRGKFEEYICSMLSSIKYGEFLLKGEAAQVSIIAPDSSTTDAFGHEFITAFKTTRAFSLWDRTTDSMIFDLFDHKHPCEGKTSTLEDVSLRLTSGIYDLHLDEHLAKNLGPTREKLGQAINTGSQTAWKYANDWGQQLAKYRREQINKQEAQTEEGTPHSPTKGVYHVSAAASSSSEDHHKDGGGAASFLTPAQQQAASDFQKQASAAAMQAGTQMKSALGSFGSFLSSKQKQWAAGQQTSSRPATPSSNSAPATSEGEKTI